jgi:hypothetical protein
MTASNLVKPVFRRSTSILIAKEPALSRQQTEQLSHMKPVPSLYSRSRHKYIHTFSVLSTGRFAVIRMACCLLFARELLHVVGEGPTETKRRTALGGPCEPQLGVECYVYAMTLRHDAAAVAG